MSSDDWPMTYTQALCEDKGYSMTGEKKPVHWKQLVIESFTHKYISD